MNTKYSLLKALEAQKGSFISGERLAASLNVSRTAIWKAIQTLKEEGFEIESAERQGYRLSFGSDKLSAPAVELSLKRKVFDITVLAETGSTNDDAKKLAEKGADQFTVIAAEYQNKGKGRLGRTFFSPRGTGIYFSIILRPQIPIKDCLYITTAAAVATAAAIEEVMGQKTGIKWVNDIFVNGKKVCGILTEASIDIENGSLAYAVLGIGVNVCPPPGGFPQDIGQIAGYVCPDGQYTPGMRSRLLAKILDNFYELYIRFPEKTFLNEYRRRSIVIGREVNVIKGEEQYAAKAIAIDDDCRLIVQKDGQEITVDSGEVSIKIGGVKN